MTATEIREACQVLGVSQGGLGKLLGYSARTVRRYAAGKPIPKLAEEKIRALVSAKRAEAA